MVFHNSATKELLNGGEIRNLILMEQKKRSRKHLRLFNLLIYIEIPSSGFRCRLKIDKILKPY